MKITTSRGPDDVWIAIDEDTYDAESDSVGAWSGCHEHPPHDPDGHRAAQMCGVRLRDQRHQPRTDGA